MLGGADVVVFGRGMASDAPSNFPQYIVDDVSKTIAWPGAAINDDEAFLSAPSAGKLQVRTPSLLDLFGATWEDFDGRGSLPTGHSTIATYLEIATSTYTDPALGCATSSACKLKYKREYTPHLIDTTPNQVYAGQRIDFIFDIKDVHDDSITPETYFPVEDLRIGRTNCDWDGIMDYRTRLDSY